MDAEQEARIDAKLDKAIEQVDKLKGVALGLAYESARDKSRIKTLHTAIEQVLNTWESINQPMTASEAILRNALLTTQP